MDRNNSDPISSSYPKYIERGGEQAIEQPYQLQDTKLFGFILEAEKQCLQALCDKYLNQPTQGKFKYKPVSSRLILTFDSIGDIHSTVPSERNRGSFSEEGEVVFWILTHSKRGFAWFIPYIFVNSSLALISGREVYGFPKEWAWFEIPPDPSDPQFFSLETVATKTFDPRARVTRQKLLSIRPVSKCAETRETLLNDNAIDAAIDFLQLAMPEAGSLIKTQMPVVFLKQFRDIQDGSRACYQAIVEAEVKLDRVYGFYPFGKKFQIDIQNLASHPIVSELGLKPEQVATLAFWSNFDFTLKNGKEIWKTTA